jgi:hypothetical protein
VKRSTFLISVVSHKFVNQKNNQLNGTKKRNEKESTSKHLSVRNVEEEKKNENKNY